MVAVSRPFGATELVRTPFGSVLSQHGQISLGWWYDHRNETEWLKRPYPDFSQDFISSKGYLAVLIKGEKK